MEASSRGGQNPPLGRWVRIHRVELGPSERSPSVPEDTAAVPFEAWINGWLLGDARLGEQVRITTVTGRAVEGELIEENPGYWHTFGSPPQPLQRASGNASTLLSSRAEQ
jgi:2-amino-4-ketopentanoate thiolase alpha subunit